jgi:SPP1 family predicted phage head-tail adaptor
LGGVLIKRYPISPSELTERVTLEYQTRISDGSGGFITSWVVGATVWAKVTTMRSSEAVINMQTTGTAIHNIVIRYRTDLKFSWRIGHRGKYYSLIGPPIDLGMQREFLDIKAKEVA